MSGREPHLGRSHPVAQVAARHCVEHGPLPPGARLGGVACGRCWERAIRDDQTAVVECGLPRDVDRDPGLVDEVAVERAMRGEPVVLTAAERAAALEQLAAEGVPPTPAQATVRDAELRGRGRRCVWCSAPLPASATTHRLTCSKGCRDARSGAGAARRSGRAA
jgi:hypothetical protein